MRAALNGVLIKPWLVAASASWGVHLAQRSAALARAALFESNFSFEGSGSRPPDGSGLTLLGGVIQKEVFRSFFFHWGGLSKKSRSRSSKFTRVIRSITPRIHFASSDRPQRRQCSSVRINPCAVSTIRAWVPQHKLWSSSSSGHGGNSLSSSGSVRRWSGQYGDANAPAA